MKPSVLYCREYFQYVDISRCYSCPYVKGCREFEKAIQNSAQTTPSYRQSTAESHSPSEN